MPPSTLGSVVRNLDFTGATPAVRHARAPARAPAPIAAHEETEPSAEIPSATQSAAAPIQVVLRVRPLSEKERASGASSCVLRNPNDETSVRIRLLVPKKHSVQVRNAGAAMFRFERVFDEASSQSDVFEHTALPMIEGLFRGQSAVVLAYGVTCSGKTWTIQGNDVHPGILPRSLDVIVNSIACAKGNGLLQESVVSEDVAKLTESRADNGLRRNRQRGCKHATGKAHDSNYIEVNGKVEYTIFASYLEIYNEQCYDLFQSQASSDRLESALEEGPVCAEPPTDPRRNPRAKQVLKLKEDAAGEVYAEGITEIEIQNGADIDRLLEFGHQNRFVASTTANETSSRSHAVFFIKLRQTEKIKQPRGPPKVVHTFSKLSIVDLAGSERLSRTQNTGQRQVEANKINTSLMNLGRCLKEMRHNQKIRESNPTRKLNLVPFRESRLTRLLQHCLQSGSAVMIANASPAMYDADETIHALRCAAVAREVRIPAGKRKLALRNRATVLQNIDQNVFLSSANKNGNLNKKQGTGSVRTRAHAVKERKDCASRAGISKPKARDPRDKIIADMKKEINLLRMEIEELRLDTAQEKQELYRENDELFRLNEKLKDKLADSEARVFLVAQEVREEVADDAEKILREWQETYLRNNLHQDGNRASDISEADRRADAERLAHRVAMRASQAAFDGIKVCLAEEELEDELDNSAAIIIEDDEEYKEED